MPVKYWNLKTHIWAWNTAFVCKIWNLADFFPISYQVCKTSIFSKKQCQKWLCPKCSASPIFGNRSLWKGSTPLEDCIGPFLENLFSNFRLYIKDSKWGRKCIIMNYASCNGSPQQIPLRQLPFANEAKPVTIAEHSGQSLGFVVDLCSVYIASFRLEPKWTHQKILLLS